MAEGHVVIRRVGEQAVEGFPNQLITLRLGVNGVLENGWVGNAGLADDSFERLLNHFGVCALMLNRMGHEITCDNEASEYRHSATHRFAAARLLRSGKNAVSAPWYAHSGHVPRNGMGVQSRPAPL